MGYASFDRNSSEVAFLFKFFCNFFGNRFSGFDNSLDFFSRNFAFGKSGFIRNIVNDASIRRFEESKCLIFANDAKCPTKPIFGPSGVAIGQIRP